MSGAVKLRGATPVEVEVFTRLHEPSFSLEVRSQMTKEAEQQKQKCAVYCGMLIGLERRRVCSKRWRRP